MYNDIKVLITVNNEAVACSHDINSSESIPIVSGDLIEP